MYILMKMEKLQRGISSRPQISISKSLKSVYMYGCILSLKILRKLYKHKALEFIEGKSSFSRYHKYPPLFLRPQTTPRYILVSSTYHLNKFERKSSKYRIYMNLYNKTSKFHVFIPNTPLNVSFRNLSYGNYMFSECTWKTNVIIKNICLVTNLKMITRM